MPRTIDFEESRLKCRYDTCKTITGMHDSRIDIPFTASELRSGMSQRVDMARDYKILYEKYRELLTNQKEIDYA